MSEDKIIARKFNNDNVTRDKVPIKSSGVSGEKAEVKDIFDKETKVPAKSSGSIMQSEIQNQEDVSFSKKQEPKGLPEMATPFTINNPTYLTNIKTLNIPH